MKIIKVWNDNPSPDQVSEVSGILDDGEVAIMPTDTLYGIVCDALNVKAIEKVCRLKGINPEKTNLSIICSDISMAAEYVKIDNEDFRILKENTPGPFTFLMRASSKLPKAFKGRKTVGVRIPDNQLCREVATDLGRPLLTTSVNAEDEDNLRNPGLIAENYENKVALFVEDEEGGTLPSAIIDMTGAEPEIIRHGERDPEL